MTAPHLHRAFFSLGGIGLLCLFCTIQKKIFHIPLTAESYCIPILVGGIGGLLLANRNLRIAALHQDLQQAHTRLSKVHDESEDRYRLLFEQSKAVQLLIDPATGDFVEVNEAAHLLYGYTAEQFRSMRIFDLNTAAPQTTRDNMQRALRREQLCFQVQHRLQSGTVVPVAVYTVPLPLRGTTLLHSVVIDLSDQNRAETDLRRKTMEQRLLLDSIPVSIWYLKDPETYGSVNKAFVDNFQHRTPADVAHHRLEDILTPEMLAQALASNRTVFQEKQPLHYEQWVHFGQSPPRYMTITKTPKLDKQGQVEFVVCTATDITDMQQTTELLRIERDLHVALTATHSLEETLHRCLAKVIDISGADCGGVYQVDPHDGSLHLMVHQGLSTAFINAAITYAADSAHARLVRRNQPVYSNFEKLSRRVNSIVTLRHEGLKAMAVLPISFEGRVIACLNVASHTNDHINAFSRSALERIMAHLGTFLVQKQQAALVLQSQRDLESLFNSIRDLVFILDMEGRIVHLNAAAASRLGYHPSELIGHSVLTVHPQERHQEAMEILASFLVGKHSVCPLPLLTKQGEEIPAETHLSLGEWSGAKVIFGLSRDIGERLQIEQQHRLLLKNEGLERMAGAIAHHFNNLMAIVVGNVELAYEETPMDSRAFRFLNNALVGCNRAIELGRSLLTYTGHFVEETIVLDLAALCRNHLRTIMATLPQSIVFEEHYASPGPMVDADPQQLEQVISALITNAVESIEQESGRVAVRIASIAASDIIADHLFPAAWNPDQDRYGSLEVRDNGSGITPQRMANIFDPFYSEKFVGRGLGLPLALSIIKKLGGAIGVSSQPNNGSLFQVFLPETSGVCHDEIPSQENCLPT